MSVPNPNKLLVEGKEDQFAIAALMAAHVAWGDGPEEWPVYIQAFDGINNLLEKGRIALEWKASRLRKLGIVTDANENLDSRWNQIRDRCSEFVPDLPVDLPPDGLIRTHSEQKRLGIWIMPDNTSRGMLETFLKFLVPDQEDALWQYAQNAAKHAQRRGAPFKNQHLDKARVHTWLAWQDPPGAPLGLALARKCLDPESEYAAPFVRWFRNLYEL